MRPHACYWIGLFFSIYLIHRTRINVQQSTGNKPAMMQDRPAAVTSGARPEVVLLLLFLLSTVGAFVPLAIGVPVRVGTAPFPSPSPFRYGSRSPLQMRDASMVVDFAVGDRVRVKPGVVLDGRDWGGLEGVVQYTWEKCEVCGYVNM